MKCGRTACTNEAEGWIHPDLALDYCNKCRIGILRHNPTLFLINRTVLMAKINSTVPKAALTELLTTQQLMGFANEYGLVRRSDPVPSDLPAQESGQDSDRNRA